MHDCGGIFPEGRFAALVRAAVGPGDAAEAWADYRRRLGAASAGEGERRLWPLIAAHGVRDPALRGERRRALAANQIALAAAARLVDGLAARGVEVTFSKGFALAARAYRAPGLRGFADLDIHVAAEDMPAVAAMAAAEGWVQKGLPRPVTPAMLEAHPALAWQLPGGPEADFHWRPRRAFAHLPQLAARLRADRREAAWEGRSWPLAGDTWLLIETVEHGLAWNEVAPIRWIADGVTLLSAPDCRVDWDLVLEAARAARLVPVFAAGLAVQAAAGAPVPVRVLDALGAARPGWLERLEYRRRLRPPPRLFPSFASELVHHCLRAPGPLPLRLARFPGRFRRGFHGSAGWLEFSRRALASLRR